MLIRFCLAVGIFFTLLWRSLMDTALPFIGITAVTTILGAIVAGLSGGAALAGALWAGGLTVGALLLFSVFRVLSVLR